MEMSQHNEVFAFIRFKEQGCGCIDFFSTPRAFAGSVIEDEYLRESIADGRVRTVMSRAEFEVFPWTCPKCKQNEVQS